MPISVSPKQFRDIDFINIARNALKNKLNPHQLTLEITEGILTINI